MKRQLTQYPNIFTVQTTAKKKKKKERNKEKEKKKKIQF